MPHALSSNGILLGFLVILVSGFTSGAGLFLQYRCSRYLTRGTASFFALAQQTYPQLAVLFDTAIAVKCFGVGVSYLIIIGDLMPQVIVDFFYSDAAELPYNTADSRHFWVSFAMVALIPLCFMRRLDSLKYTSIIALVSLGYLTLLVLGHWMIGDTLESRGEISLTPKSLTSVLSSLPVVVFGFTCHQNMFSVVNELRDNRQDSVLRIILSSIGSAIVLYSLVGFTGYLSFGDTVSGNISNMYASSFASAVGRLAIVILVLFSYPLQCHPCRASVDHIFTHFILPTVTGTPAPSALSSRTSNKVIPTRRFIITTALIMLLSYIIAMTVTSLETVLAFVGATGSTSISFILPGLFGYKLLGSPYHLPIPETTYDDEQLLDSAADGVHPAVHLQQQREQVPRVSSPAPEDEDREMLRSVDGEGYYIKYGSLLLACWGIFIMVACLSSNIYSLYYIEEEHLGH
ncbi:transmembrane amino acid transporter protein-domain-containing protein [Myxozyma melibiosi]|uniref:Transmembrane amino acid transporter protein-domain-containing protein n=1 Tax=Myxozyma melibiosi TaxID=54550 RepID=A0ABR1F999_9ASCO